MTDLTLDRLSGRIGVAFQDDRSGLDPVRPDRWVQLSLRRRGPGGGARNTPILITSATTTASNDPTAAQAVTLTLNRGRQIRGGRFTFTILSGGIQDVAGNALDGEFYGSFPSGNDRPGGDFVARVGSIHRVVSPPIPIQNGTASPLAPAGRRGQRFVLGVGSNRFQAERARQEVGADSSRWPEPSSQKWASADRSSYKPAGSQQEAPAEAERSRRFSRVSQAMNSTLARRFGGRVFSLDPQISGRNFEQNLVGRPPEEFHSQGKGRPPAHLTSCCCWVD